MEFKVVVVLLIVSQCGVALARKHQGRIVGGIVAGTGDFPYTVSVQRMIYVYVPVCGGALIKENYVLTAAHCLDDNPIQVKAGLLKTLSTRTPKSQVIERYVHPDYAITNNRTTNDVAVLKLADSFVLSATVQLINLPPSNAAVSGKAVFSGWGSTNSSVETFSYHLFYAVLDVISLDQCSSDLITSTGSNQSLSDGNVCTSSPKSFTCYRDDGGPLVQNVTLVGIASWQIVPCDAKGAPSIFTKVSNYVDWINDKIAQ